MSQEIIQPIKPTVGKRYMLRNGMTTSPIRTSNNGTNYVFEADIYVPGYATPSVFSWLRNGSFLTVAESHRYDIVKEIE